MKRNILLVIILFATITFISCSSIGSNKNKTIGDLIEHFKKNGIDGQYEPMMMQFLYGCSESAYYSRWDSEGKEIVFSIYIMKFDDINKAKSVEKTGIRFCNSVYRNGYFVIGVGRDDTGGKVVQVFKKF